MTESEELARLGQLHRDGVLTEAEFTRAKARVLAGSAAPVGGGGLHGLRRSRDDRWLGGVCGGLGHTTEVPSWVWRLLFTLLLLCAGTGVVFYLLLWIFIPLEPGTSASASPIG